jgi:hypothetical protein
MHSLAVDGIRVGQFKSAAKSDAKSRVEHSLILSKEQLAQAKEDFCEGYGLSIFPFARVC